MQGEWNPLPSARRRRRDYIPSFWSFGMML